MNIYELKKKIQLLNPEEFPLWNSLFLDEVSELPQFSNLLESIVNDEDELKRICKSSFFHNSGFIRINIIGWDIFPCMLKLHIWGLNDFINRKEIEFTIHNHLYDFSSHIITGCLSTNLYIESNEGIEFNKYINPLLSNEYVFDFVDKKYLKRLSQLNLCRGSSYWIDHQTLHFAAPSLDTPTSTLCLQSPLRKRLTLIYSQKILENSIPQSQRFTTSALKNILKNYLLLL